MHTLPQGVHDAWIQLLFYMSREHSPTPCALLPCSRTCVMVQRSPDSADAVMTMMKPARLNSASPYTSRRSPTQMMAITVPRLALGLQEHDQICRHDRRQSPSTSIGSSMQAPTTSRASVSSPAQAHPDESRPKQVACDSRLLRWHTIAAVGHTSPGPMQSRRRAGTPALWTCTWCRRTA